MSHLHSRSRCLLEAARSSKPTPEVRRRMERAIAAQVGVATIVGAAAASTTAAAPASTTGASGIGSSVAGSSVAGASATPTTLTASFVFASAWSVKGAVVGVMLLGAAGIGASAIHRPSALATSSTSASSTLAVTSKTATPSAESSHADSPLASSAPATSVSRAESADPLVANEAADAPPQAAQARIAEAKRASVNHARPSADVVPIALGGAITEPRVGSPQQKNARSELDEEVALLREAQSALKRGEGAQALTALDDLAARHPDGALREERQAARVLASCAAGRTAEAELAGRAFMNQFPSSIHSDRVRSSCAFIPSPGSAIGKPSP